MTQQPAMPSRHVCQVKYRKVGLEQGERDTRYHMAPMPAAGQAQQGLLCQGANWPPPANPAVPAQGMSGTPDTCRRGHRGEMVPPRAPGSPLLPAPDKRGY